MFTTEVVSYPGIVHIGDDKDFTQVIEKSLELGGYEENMLFTGINGGSTVMTGFGFGRNWWIPTHYGYGTMQ